MKKFLFSVCLGVASLGLPAVSAQAATITEIVAASGGEFDNNKFDYDILLNAVLAAGLEGALADPNANLTVFAPRDAAFIRTARDLGFTGTDEAGAWNFLVGAFTALGNGDPIPVLTAVLLYHVSPEEIRPIDLIIRTYFGMTIDTLQGGTIRPFFLRLIDNEPNLRNPNVTIPLNINADNGVIHTIDRVLIPIDLP